jgi:hypothetical protein
MTIVKIDVDDNYKAISSKIVHSNVFIDDFIF